MKQLLLLVAVCVSICACEKKETPEQCVSWIYRNIQVGTGTLYFNYMDQKSQQKKEYYYLNIKGQNNNPVMSIANKSVAMKLSKNWTLDENMKLYTEDGILEEHEKDACETKERVIDFLHHLADLHKANQELLSIAEPTI